jgi:hypothetical protein
VAPSVDGWSIVTGHEYAEAVTDPDNFLSDQDGWNDAQGNENGDKCAWTGTQEHLARDALVRRAAVVEQGGRYDATSNGCAVSR